MNISAYLLDDIKIKAAVVINGSSVVGPSLSSRMYLKKFNLERFILFKLLVRYGEI